ERPDVDVAAFNTPEVRAAVLEGMVMRRILLLEAKRLRLDVRAAMREWIQNTPEFQDPKSGAFSQERYESVLRNINRSAPEYEALLQEDMLQQVLLGTVMRSAFVPQTVARQFAALWMEKRTVEESQTTWQSLMGQVEATEAEAQQFYDANAPKFTLPEQVRVEYLVLSSKDLEDKNKLDEKTLRAWYDAHKERFAVVVEKRRVRHILVPSKADAEALLAEVRQNPERFAELAKSKSTDPGSASLGGDVGVFARTGGMVESFANAAFALKEVGEISDVVESEFGFHIILLTEIQPGKYRPFAEVRADVEAELKREGAAQRFAEDSEKFADLVFRQFDSLKPAADAFGLKVRQSNWLTREADPRAGDEALRSAILRSAIFDDEVLTKGHNSKAVSVTPGVMASARLLEHRPAALVPFADVRQDIQDFLRREKAQALAVERGKANLAELEKAGPDAPIKPLNARLKLKWSKAQDVSRLQRGKLDALSIDAIFRAPGEQKPPFYTGVELPGVGYAIYKINRVTAGEVQESDLAEAQGSLTQMNAQLQRNAYQAALRQRYAVEINEKLLQEEGGKKD
ncbi:MAG: peptidyl-prolyl cis-trans isomerase, partial [Zoogloeaceae bacterium]|nr:peptidyl-prolyl cis-trans isomerase [Zoogloeaceae bacterium]